MGVSIFIVEFLLSGEKKAALKKYFSQHQLVISETNFTDGDAALTCN